MRVTLMAVAFLSLGCLIVEARDQLEDENAEIEHLLVKLLEKRRKDEGTNNVDRQSNGGNDRNGGGNNRDGGGNNRNGGGNNRDGGGNNRNGGGDSNNGGNNNNNNNNGAKLLSEQQVEDVLRYIPTAYDIATNRRNEQVSRESDAARRDSQTRQDDTPAALDQRYQNSTDYVRKVAEVGKRQLEVLKIVEDKFNLTANQMRQVIAAGSPATSGQRSRQDETNQPPPRDSRCPYPKYECDSSEAYRSFDGSCNNLVHPLLGRAFTPLARFLTADYSDGFNHTRLSSRRKELPSARLVSRTIFEAADKTIGVHTLGLMSWGQYLDHDITHTAISSLFTTADGVSGSEPVTCGTDGCATGDAELESCFPIPVPSGDPDHSTSCLSFVRSEGVPPLDCRLGMREQINQITSFLDSSQVYGSSKEEADHLRDFSDTSRGRMKTSSHPTDDKLKNLLPHDDEAFCRGATSTDKCFLAGDERVNENVGLTTMHLIFVREHNKIEQHLHEENPQWSGTKLFQESRKIVIAGHQHITFNEYLPLILGEEMNKYVGAYPGYDQTVDPSMSNVFATAAYRFGHTQIKDAWKRFNGNHDEIDAIFLSQIFFNPSAMYDTANGGVDSVARGFVDNDVAATDNSFTSQVTKSLFTAAPPHGVGLDLGALNIQRGRDHGIPGYNEWRGACNLPLISDFDSMATTTGIKTEIVEQFRTLYENVADIDLYPAAISEPTVAGGVVGPTFACLIGRQFNKVRNGDRFWYERNTQFTPAQLRELRKQTFAKMICENMDSLDTIQPRAFLLRRSAVDASSSFFTDYSMNKLFGAANNERVKCSDLLSMDFAAWKSTTA